MMERNNAIIIAEAGVNHNGSIELAEQLIAVAAKAGADFVKFQTFNADRLVSKDAKKAAYQIANINDGDDSQFQMLKKLELSYEDHFHLKEYAKRAGIKFLSTGFDEECVDFLDSIGVELFKIPSGEITNKPYLQHIGRKGKNVIMSTGMASLGDIENALHVLVQEGLSKSQITILHCNTQYPTPYEDVNLAAMHSIRQAFDIKVGYSDHTLGIEVPIAAVACGAVVIEKHFTIDRNLPGPDHLASLEPDELISMVRGIRNIEKALSGDGVKRPSKSEFENRKVIRKSIFVRQAIRKGEVISEDMLVMKRPADGISPMLIDTIVGRKASVDLYEGKQLAFTDLI